MAITEPNKEDIYNHEKFCEDLDGVLADLRAMLVDKNQKYGNSVLEPVRVFSKADTKEQIKVRLDDKLSRLARGTGEDDEDVYLDLTGYLIMFRIAE